MKLGFNYGTSRLSHADNEVDPTLVQLNDKFTLGVYDQLTPNLMLLAEGTSMWSRNQLGDENKAWVATSAHSFRSDRASWKRFDARQPVTRLARLW